MLTLPLHAGPSQREMEPRGPRAGLRSRRPCGWRGMSGWGLHSCSYVRSSTHPEGGHGETRVGWLEGKGGCVCVSLETRELMKGIEGHRRWRLSLPGVRESPCMGHAWSRARPGLRGVWKSRPERVRPREGHRLLLVAAITTHDLVCGQPGCPSERACGEGGWE